MLVGCFIVVVQTANSGLLFVLHDFLFQNFEFKIHEVELLLKVLDVLITDRIVRVAKLVLVFHILTSEVHLNS
jgi:hypothetical protein